MRWGGNGESMGEIALTQLQQRYDPRSKEVHDRRTAGRIVTICRLVKLKCENEEGLARCRNISSGGVRLETYMSVRVQDRVTIAFSPSVEINGTFAWIDGAESGISFDAPIDCIAVLRKTAPSNPGTRPPRVKTALPASVSFPGGKCCAMVNDLSLQGMKLTHDGTLHPGLNVTVMLADGLERRGMVCWTRDGFAGLQLVDRFRLAELPPLLAAT